MLEQIFSHFFTKLYHPFQAMSLPQYTIHYPVMQMLRKVLEPLQPTALDHLPALAFIDDKYKMKPSLIALLLFALLLLLTPLFGTYLLLTRIVCYVIPAYLSFRALQSHDRDGQARYLTYWILFAALELLTPFLRFLLSKYLFMLFRVAFTLLLLHPLSDLASLLYRALPQPEPLHEAAEAARKAVGLQQS